MQEPDEHGPPTTGDLVHDLRQQTARDAAAAIRSLIDPDSGRIDNWSEGRR